MNLSNEGDCIHGREFCLECNDKKIPRRPESIGQAHRIMCQMRATIEQQQAEITELKTKLKTAEKWDAIESQRNEELKAEINVLRRGLREAMEWNWLDEAAPPKDIAIQLTDLIAPQEPSDEISDNTD